MIPVGRVVVPVGIAVIAACSISIQEPLLHPPAPGVLPPPTDTLLKAHHRSGALDVLRRWALDGDSVLVGWGERFTPTRMSAGFADVRLPLDSVVLFETNASATQPFLSQGLMVAYVAVRGAFTLACVADPKGCFGSCPTFYLGPDDATGRPVAEGFSSSIARILEDTDVDDLRLERAGGSTVPLWMRNEAWETHAVRSVRLLAVPVRAGERIRPWARYPQGIPPGIFDPPGDPALSASATAVPDRAASPPGRP